MADTDKKQKKQKGMFVLRQGRFIALVFSITFRGKRDIGYYLFPIFYGCLAPQQGLKRPTG